MGVADYCPCNGCRERHEACHSKCGDYIVWKLARKDIAEKIRAEHDAYTDHDHQPYWHKYRRDNKRGQT